jgi:hypothetical protein
VRLPVPVRHGIDRRARFLGDWMPRCWGRVSYEPQKAYMPPPFAAAPRSASARFRDSSNLSR